MQEKLPPQPVLLVLMACLIVAMMGASAHGAMSIPWSSLPRLLWGELQPGEALLQKVLFDIRLPRVLFSALTGAALAITGVTMQALFRNPLAEPGLVGISAGAALGAVFAIVMTAGGFLTVAAAAFAGSLGATFLAYSIGRRYSGVAGLLLAGIAINTVAGSAIGVFTYLANDTQLRDLTFWSMGSLAAADWKTFFLLGPWTALLVGYLCLQWRTLNALLLGEREAGHLGFELVRVRRRLIVITALIIGPLVAVTGGIGFIGLVVPHLVRMMLGAHHRYLMPVSVVAGALLLTLADWLARVVMSPAELPIGLVTSLVGGPFFFLAAQSRPIGQLMSKDSRADMPSALHGGTTYNCDELAAWALTVQRGQRTVLQRTGLRLEAGEVVCLLGANGAGKTTFLTALAGELKLDRRLHDKQAILMNGTELTSLRTTQQAQSRAVLPQKPGLSFDLQVMEVVAMGAYPFPELSNAQVHDLSSKALAKAELEDLAQRRYLALSGGEQQRVQFARVLVQVLAQRSQDPRGRYLLLDEPTASLDPLHQQRLLQTVRELAQTERIGVLLILHDINLAASWSDRVALLAEGKILACGPPASVLTQKHLYTVYGVEAHIMPHPTRAGRPLIVL